MFKRLQGKYLSLFLFVNRYIRLVMFWTQRLYVLMIKNCYNNVLVNEKEMTHFPD